MIRQTIKELEERIRQSGQIAQEDREQLLDLVTQVQEELENLPEQSRSELAAQVKLERVAQASELSREEAQKELDAIRRASTDFSGAMLRFETAHPRLTDLANRLAMMLSSVGI